MDKIINIISYSYKGYANRLWDTVLHPFPENGINYFYFLIAISLVVWALELLMPWRKNQKAFRKDFWLDGFYMFFNFFIFNLILFIALSNTTAHLFQQGVGSIGLPKYLIDLGGLNPILQLVIFFFVADFIQWNIHRLLHKVPFLWKAHKVHHSVREMGFAAHLRYHFIETFVYKTALYIGVSYLFHFKLENAFIIHMFTIAVGHLNHANLGWDYGPLKYILNNPKMHIWHHAKALPEAHPTGVNFGITLSIWDYLFGTDHIPSSGRDIELGFEDVEKYPEGFIGQQVAPFKSEE